MELLHEDWGIWTPATLMAVSVPYRQHFPGRPSPAPLGSWLVLSSGVEHVVPPGDIPHRIRSANAAGQQRAPTATPKEAGNQRAGFGGSPVQSSHAWSSPAEAVEWWHAVLTVESAAERAVFTPSPASRNETEPPQHQHMPPVRDSDLQAPTLPTNAALGPSDDMSVASGSSGRPSSRLSFQWKYFGSYLAPASPEPESFHSQGGAAIDNAVDVAGEADGTQDLSVPELPPSRLNFEASAAFEPNVFDRFPASHYEAAAETSPTALDTSAETPDEEAA
jgi:hypothetical protein